MGVIMEEVRSFITKTFAADGINYLQNFRHWDYEPIMKFGEFKETDVVIEAGALHTYFSTYLAQFVDKIYITDNFYWAKRDYMIHNNCIPVDKWMAVVQSKLKNGVVEEADIQAMPYEDNTFDKVVSISTMEHVIEDKKGMSELKRILKPGGLVLMTLEYNPKFPKDYSETDGSFYRVYDDAGVTNLIEGFKLEEKISDETNMDNFHQGNFTTLFVKLRKE